MSTLSKHLFQYNRGLPKRQLKPAGASEDRWGYGPAPFLSPVSDIHAINSPGDGDDPDGSLPWYNGTDGGMYRFETEEQLQKFYQVYHPDSEYEGKFQTINVVDSFPWSHSPQTSMTGINDDVPTISLMEHNMLQNPAINAMLYNMFTGLDVLGENTTKIATQAAEDAIETTTGFLNGVLDKFGDGTVSAFTKSATANLKDRLLNVVGSLDRSGDKKLTEKYPSRLTLPYRRLYATQPTGFKYKLPYFTDTYRYANPMFSDTSGNGNLPFQASISNMTGFVGSVVNAINTSTSGTYIEQPKYPNFPSETKSYSFSFPLLNTVDQEATQKNWELVFMLMYQNIPNRITRSAIAPPHIYECLIPGIWYSRYAYMSRVEVTMVGSRRTMPIKMHSSLASIEEPGFESLKQIKTIVPDAYMVNITMTELIPESRNYALESLRQSDLVEVVDSSDMDTRSGQAINAAGFADGIEASATAAIDQASTNAVNSFLDDLYS